MATYNGADKRLEFLFDMVSNFAQDYSDAGTYAVGAYAIYQGVLYKCTTAVSVAEAFDPTKWAHVLVMGEISTGGGGGSVVTITPTLSSGTKIADYTINGAGGELYAPSGGGSSGHVYSTDEQVVGTWTDGSTVYEKTFLWTTAMSIAVNGAWYDTNINISYVDKIIDASIGNNTWRIGVLSVFKQSNKLYITSGGAMGSNTLSVNRVILRYTKTAS